MLLLLAAKTPLDKTTSTTAHSTTIDMTLILEQKQENLTVTETGDELICRTIYPSEAYGGWPGNKETVRLWTIHRKGKRAAYLPCTQEEVLAFEKARNEWPRIGFITHPTLGEVCIEAK